MREIWAYGKDIPCGVGVRCKLTCVCSCLRRPLFHVLDISSDLLNDRNRQTNTPPILFHLIYLKTLKCMDIKHGDKRIWKRWAWAFLTFMCYSSMSIIKESDNKFILQKVHLLTRIESEIDIIEFEFKPLQIGFDAYLSSPRIKTSM